MDRSQLAKRLLETFLVELQDHVQSLNRELLALKRATDQAERAERLKQLFRTAHSLKGAARSVNARLIEDACHHLEEILAAQRDSASGPSTRFFSLLFAAADAIEEAGQRLREEQNLAGSPLSGLLPKLATALQPEARGEPGPVRAGSAELLPELTQPGSPVPSLTLPGSPVPSLTLPALPGSPLPELTQPGSPPPGTRSSPAPLAEIATVRIAAEKLDALLARSGELLVASGRVQSRAEELAGLREAVSRWRAEWQAIERPLARLRPAGNGSRRMAEALDGVGSRLRKLEKDLERLTTTLVSDSRLLGQVAGALDDEVRGARMQPFADACQGLERMVHDLASAAGKEMDLVVNGGNVELDRSVLEGLKDPLRHLVRNAIDHGVEPPDVRRLAGKPPRSRLVVEAVLRGTQVEVVVADDGRGIDLEALRLQVRKRRLPEPGDERELARLVFHPGLSTAKLVTDVSGRGVGLDVVKSNVEAMHGTVDVAFTAGQGTRFTIAVPLTLTTLHAVLLVVGRQTFAVVGTHVEKLLRIDPAELRWIQGRQMLPLGGTPLPVVSLAGTLGMSDQERSPAEGKRPGLILTVGHQRVVFVVDELLAEQEIVVKALPPRIRRTRYVSAATILPSGQVALVLNVANLVRSALLSATDAQTRATADTAVAEAPAVQTRKRILIAEDSLTTRNLEKTILEAAGYEVTAVPGGEEAWKCLQTEGASYDLLVSDVEMPQMDGFALTKAVRSSARYRDLPVVLVTARESETDKARGLEVGANAYLMKSTFDQRNLLETIAQLL